MVEIKTKYIWFPQIVIAYFSICHNGFSFWQNPGTEWAWGGAWPSGGPVSIRASMATTMTVVFNYGLLIVTYKSNTLVENTNICRWIISRVKGLFNASYLSLYINLKAYELHARARFRHVSKGVYTISFPFFYQTPGLNLWKKLGKEKRNTQRYECVGGVLYLRPKSRYYRFSRAKNILSTRLRQNLSFLSFRSRCIVHISRFLVPSMIIMDTMTCIAHLVLSSTVVVDRTVMIPPLMTRNYHWQ